MSRWNQALDAAGIRDPGLRQDYTEQRELAARYKRSLFVAARLLLPAPLLPHAIATVAFMHHSDNLLDAGPRAGRAAAYAAWEKEVRAGLATGGSDHPAIRPLLHTVTAHPQLHGRVEDFLAGAPTDLHFSGFGTEADYQRYLDAYSLPGFMLNACLLAPGDVPAGYREACRTYIDGAQRLDFVNDLAEDLRDGRLTIPEDTLKRYAVTRADLEHARDLPGAGELLRDLLDQARRALDASRPMIGFTSPANRPLVRSLLALDGLTADAAVAKGTGLLRGSARPAVPAALRVLAREYRQARRLR